MSRLPLSERLPGQAKKPQKLLSWSITDSGIFFDDRSLNYFYLPRPDVERGINLSVGFEPNVDLDHSTTLLDGVLNGLLKLEETTREKTQAQIVCWRGLLTQLLIRSQGHVDRYALAEELSVEVVKFDGQIFLSQRKTPKTQGDLKFMYSGYKFEEAATLPKPWGECTREEIEQRYVKPLRKEKDQYCILVKSGVGGVECVYGAEADCVEKTPTTDSTNEFIELKTTRVIEHRGQAASFERKLMRTWLQSFLVGIPRVVYGFRDDQLMLRAVEDFRVAAMPQLIKRSKVLKPEQKWSGNDIIAFYNVLVHWLVDRVEDDQTYVLSFQPNSTEFRLAKEEIKHENREIAFLSNDFVNWRRELAKATTSV